MANVNIIRHNPIAIFSGTTETIITYDDKSVIRHVEPSGNVGSQYPKELGSQWFGTIENLNAGLAKGGVTWDDVYKTDVLWTTPEGGRDVCDAYKNDFNAVYGAFLSEVTGCGQRSNRMARFTHPEGFPDPEALFEVQIKAVKGGATIGGGTLDYGEWQDHQPSGASVLHKGSDGSLISTLGDDLKQEMEFVLVEQYEKPLAEKGVNFKTQTVWLEVLVAIDDIADKTWNGVDNFSEAVQDLLGQGSQVWDRIDTVRNVVTDYFGDSLPAGAIYPVSRIPNLDGVVEPQPRCVVGKDVTIRRSNEATDGFSNWVSFDRSGVREVMVSGVGGEDADRILESIDGRIRAAGGAGLKKDGIFNNAYIVAKDSSEASRQWLADFNPSFSAFYEGVAPAGRTAQFVHGFMAEGNACGISNRSIFAL